MKFWYNPNFLAIFFLIFFSIFALKDLAKPQFYTSHDGETHTARIAQYYIALSDGQIPPRWAKTLHDGLGSPIFVYIYPLPYILGSVIHFTGFSFTDSFEILMGLSFIFSGIFTYMWLKEIWKYPRAAFIGALFYTWVPYRFSLIYVRGSLSESLAYTFLPLVLWSLTRLSLKISISQIAVTALSISLLLMSQNLIAMISSVIVTTYVVIIAVLKKSPKYFIASLIAAIWGLLIASFTYLPALMERNLIHFDELFQLVYSNHFVTFKQLIHSPWGYGFSFPGAVNDSLSFQIGLAHLLILVIASVLLLIILLQKIPVINRIKTYLLNNHIFTQLTLTVYFFVILFISIFVMLDTNLTEAFWQYFAPIRYVDIPWRFLGISTLTISFIAAFTVYKIRSGALFLLLVVAILLANRNHLRINKSTFFEDEFFLNYKGSATQYNEFTPRTRYSTGVSYKFHERVEVVKGDSKVTNIEQTSKFLSFDVESSKISKILINLVSFSGWSLTMDSKPFTNIEDPDKKPQRSYKPDRDNSGLYLLIIPSGFHHFEFIYEETPIRKISNYISFSAAALIVSIFLISLIRRNNFKQ